MSRTSAPAGRTAKLPALLVAATVLTVGLAGSATAAKMITGKNIKDNTVTTQDIKNSTLTGKDLKSGSVPEKDLAAGVKNKLNAPAVAGYEVRTVSVSVPTDGQETVFVACTPGKVALSGGARWAETQVNNVIVESRPAKVVGDLFDEPDADYADAWMITGEHTGLDAQELTAYVICVDPS